MEEVIEPFQKQKDRARWLLNQLEKGVQP